MDDKVSYSQIADRFGCSVRFLAMVRSARKQIEEAAAAGDGSQKTARKGDFPEVSYMLETPCYCDLVFSLGFSQVRAFFFRLVLPMALMSPFFFLFFFCFFFFSRGSVFFIRFFLSLLFVFFVVLSLFCCLRSLLLSRFHLIFHSLPTHPCFKVKQTFICSASCFFLPATFSKCTSLHTSEQLGTRRERASSRLTAPRSPGCILTLTVRCFALATFFTRFAALGG